MTGGGIQRARVDTTLMKALATLLITNSHFDLFYPDPRLGAGGALGNVLFFFLSGYGLAKSFSFGRSAQEPFFAYMLRRWSKLYPSLIITVLVAITLDSNWHWSQITPLNWVELLIWPTWYWFVAAIAIFYAPFYFIGKWSTTQMLLAMGLILIPYFYVYFNYLDLSVFSIEEGFGNYFKWFVSFQIMIFGAWVARSDGRINIWLAAIGFAVSAVAFFVLKSILFKRGLGSYQFIVHAIEFAFIWFGYHFLCAQPVVEFVRKIKLYAAANFLGGITLEIYLVQIPMLKHIESLHLPFPLGLLVALALILILAKLVSRLSEQVQVRLLKQT